MLDFVPNHTALDHPWVEDHPEYYVTGTELDLARAPQNYTWVKRKRRRSAPGLRPRSVLPRLARRAPAQLRQPGDAGGDDRRAAEDRRAVRRRPLRHGHAGAARGLRANLGHPVLSHSGRRRPGECGSRQPGFCFMAEVYWDLEWTLQQQGFDYTYDKRLYDRLRDRHARPVREHFRAGLDYQDKLARFLENHDEPRAAATFPPGVHEAAAVITFLSPGLRFFQQGQFQGRKKRISPHLCREPDEPVDQDLNQFYDRLLAVLRAPGRPGRAVAIARLRGRLGRELDVRLLHRLRLARPRRRAAAGRGELRRQPEPVLRPAALRGPRRQDLAVAGPSREGHS